MAAGLVSDNDFNIRVATPEDKEQVIDFAQRYFFLDEPLTIAVRLMEGGGRCTELEEYCTESLGEGSSIIATNLTGDVIGICMNGAKHRHGKEGQEGQEGKEVLPPVGLPNTKFRDIVQLLETADEQADVFGRFPDVDSFVDIKILSVHPDWRGRGIAKKMLEKTTEVADGLDFPMIRCVCTSHYTHLAVARLGYMHVHSMPYDSYTDSAGKVVFQTDYPHTNVETYILRL